MRQLEVVVMKSRILLVVLLLSPVAHAKTILQSLRLTWLVFGLSVRYERYLSGDLRDAFAIALDLGARSKAVAVPLPGESEHDF